MISDAAAAVGAVVHLPPHGVPLLPPVVVSGAVVQPVEDVADAVIGAHPAAIPLIPPYLLENLSDSSVRASLFYAVHTPLFRSPMSYMMCLLY